jgi:mono/diheme cytochrome c family protein
MFVIRRLYAIILLAFFITVPEARAGQVERTRSGEEQFQVSCAACHSGGENILKPEHPMKGSRKLKDFATFLKWIRKPVVPMPKFPSSSLSVVQAEKLYRYILTQEKTGWK